MSNQATAKGAFLAGGITLISTGIATITATIRPFELNAFIAGIGVLILGMGLIFAREWLKEN